AKGRSCQSPGEGKHFDHFSATGSRRWPNRRRSLSRPFVWRQSFVAQRGAQLEAATSSFCPQRLRKLRARQLGSRRHPSIWKAYSCSPQATAMDTGLHGRHVGMDRSFISDLEDGRKEICLAEFGAARNCLPNDPLQAVVAPLTVCATANSLSNSLLYSVLKNCATVETQLVAYF